MGYAIFRVERRKSGQAVGAMLAHALREVEVPNAIPGALPEILAGESSSSEGMKRLYSAIEAAKKIKGGWRKDAVHGLDMLVTMSRDDGQRMSKKAQDAYFRNALQWISARFGGENILTAAVHRDETTSHLQVVLLPRDETGRFTAKSLLGGRGDMRRMQDDFWKACGEPAGLLRGIEGSGATHVPVRKLYGAMEAGADAPIFEEVPPPPTLTQRLLGEAQEIDAQRRKALAANERARQALMDQAKNGRLLHPAMVSRQADRYRESVRAEDRARAQLEEARAERTLAQKLLDQAAAERREAEAERREIQVQAQAADSLWTKDGAQILDRWSVHMRSEMVSHLAKQLGVELTPGRPLLDQLRRKGKGRTMLEAAAIADRVLNGELHRHVQSGKAQQERPRQT